MSFSQSFAEARSIISMVQKNKTDGASDGHSSPILSGSEDPGVTVAHPKDELTLRRTKGHIAQTSLRRKYASTGSGGGKT